jgi:hypothetical protein
MLESAQIVWKTKIYYMLYTKFKVSNMLKSIKAVKLLWQVVLWGALLGSRISGKHIPQ